MNPPLHTPLLLPSDNFHLVLLQALTWVWRKHRCHYPFFSWTFNQGMTQILFMNVYDAVTDVISCYAFFAFDGRESVIIFYFPMHMSQAWTELCITWSGFVFITSMKCAGRRVWVMSRQNKQKDKPPSRKTNTNTRPRKLKDALHKVSIWRGPVLAVQDEIMTR